MTHAHDYRVVRVWWPHNSAATLLSRVLGARQEGVVLDAFEQLAAGKVARSTTILLVKNIPHSTTEAELRQLFGGYGDLVRVVLPPARTIALIEFAQPAEARAAFRHLAYTKFKVLPRGCRFGIAALS